MRIKFLVGTPENKEVYSWKRAEINKILNYLFDEGIIEQVTVQFDVTGFKKDQYGSYSDKDKKYMFAISPELYRYERLKKN